MQTSATLEPTKTALLHEAGPRSRARALPILTGPPGHEHLPHLAQPAPEDDVRNRPKVPVPGAVQRAARGVAEALFAYEEGAEKARFDWLEEDFTAFYGHSQGRARLVLSLALLALAWIAPLFVFRFGPLWRLPVALRTEALERIESSPLAPTALAAKAILCILWFEHPETMRETSTEPTCLGAPGVNAPTDEGEGEGDEVAA
ncbi:hypothetical protein AKJ09_11454 [Labilithrix luteola]|uniref:Uncharacterized protein n=1 Tax=Labilithrix luteola TaxID=1391654 RepID=A0A0K1QGA1_9BACT|nr:hypothetical protein [Labilithrix luteola]AKV04791.1 hypothetical protein AKJ09_11454 [Labilithrix luteola]